jgi:hypothetical protein
MGWIVNLVERKIAVYSSPGGPAEHPDYHLQQEYREPAALPLVLADREVARLGVASLLP